MPINFFEKMINVVSQEEIKNKIAITGDFASYFKGKPIVDTISRFNISAPQISDPSKK